MRIDEYLRIYEAKHDDELLLLAESSAELTDEARAALQSELARRGPRAVTAAPPVWVAVEQNVAEARSSLHQFARVGEFLNGVMSTYRAHFWFFIGIVAPSIVFAFYMRQASRMFARYLVQHYLAQHPDGIIPSTVIVEASTVGGIINFLIWICFCMCYAGVVSAVSRIRQGDAPLVGSSLDCVFERPGRFLGISALLGISFVALNGCCAFLYLWLLRMFPVQLRGATDRIVLYALYFMAVLVLSRFAFAIPAVTLGNCTVRQSVFRRDEMTEGKWSLLAALLIKSLVGGYIAAMLPFWIAGWVWPELRFYGWILSAASIAGVILVEPILFIGFSLLYLDASQTSISDEARLFRLTSNSEPTSAG